MIAILKMVETVQKTVKSHKAPWKIFIAQSKNVF